MFASPPLIPTPMGGPWGPRLLETSVGLGLNGQVLSEEAWPPRKDLITTSQGDDHPEGPFLGDTDPQLPSSQQDNEPFTGRDPQPYTWPSQAAPACIVPGPPAQGCRWQEGWPSWSTPGPSPSSPAAGMQGSMWGELGLPFIPRPPHSEFHSSPSPYRAMGKWGGIIRKIISVSRPI